jgi:site-specific recombinase XerD
MKPNITISIYHDRRRSKSNGKYPVKLRVFSPYPRRQKLYNTGYELSDEDFQQIMNLKKRSGKKSAQYQEWSEIKDDLTKIEMAAKEIVESIRPFSFEQFETHFSRKPGDGSRVGYQYKIRIDELKKANKFSTAETYASGKKSITEFLHKKKRYSFENLTFYDINVKWLKDFERFMLEDKGRSVTTLGIYLRALRTLFNHTIAQKEIDAELYPFGKGKYQIPASRNIKKTLSQEQLRQLFNIEAKQIEHQKARDFWFLSYACNGMNIKDIALLKYSNIDGETIKFFRSKTRTTSKTNLKPIVIFRNDFIDDMIRKYGTKPIKTTNYIFDILELGLTAAEQHSRIKNITRFINQHLQNLCKLNDLPEDITTYWARHSFTTNAIRNGASMEFIQESLGHGNITTTQNYFAGFESSKKKDFANTLMDF